MVDDDLKRAFADDIVFLRYAGIRPVVVHGGGPQISSMLTRLGIESEFPRRAARDDNRRRWTSSGWCSSARSGASSSGFSTSTVRWRSACRARMQVFSPLS